MNETRHPLVRLKRAGLQILITNDDGIDSPGLFALKKLLDPLGEVHVIAPDRNRTGAARSITMRSPLWVEERVLPDGSLGFCTDGTPVDCVRLAALGFMDTRPDLIVSGINLSGNLGDDITYSGTVAAAFEGIMLGIPSVAVSADGYHDGYDLSVPARVARLLVGKILDHGFPAEALLNVNCPDLPWEELCGIRFTTLGKRIYGDRVQLQESDGPRRRYFIYGDDLSYHSEAGTDFDAIGDGCVSVTPIHFHLTAHDLLGPLADWRLDLVDAPGTLEAPSGNAGATAGPATVALKPSPWDAAEFGSPVGGSSAPGFDPLDPTPSMVIFDLDGTVLDSVELIVDSFLHAISDVLGVEATRAEAIRNVGRPLLEQMRVFDESRAQELVDSYRAFNHREHDRRVRLYPGMADLLLKLRARGSSLALVTSKSRPTTEMAFRATGIGDLFDAVVCAGETEHHKPHPDPLLRVLEILGGEPGEAVYVGDSPYDLQAAAGARMRSVAVTWGVFPVEDLAAESPDRVVHSVDALASLLLPRSESTGGAG